MSWSLNVSSDFGKHNCSLGASQNNCRPQAPSSLTQPMSADYKSHNALQSRYKREIYPGKDEQIRTGMFLHRLENLSLDFLRSNAGDKE